MKTKSSSTQLICPNCGIKQEEWPIPEGIKRDGKAYCCEGCAQAKSCSCSPSGKNKKADFMEDTRPPES